MAVGQDRGDFTMESSGPYQSIRCLGTPSAPQPSHAEGDTSWRAISHLSLNYLSLTDSNETDGAAALQDILKLYGDTADLQVRQQIDGIKSVSCKPILRRLKIPGPIAFARGLEVMVILDETAFEGTGVFLLGAVLERFFAKYVTINSFTETVIRTQERGEVMRWPMRAGLKQIL
jgi:type VI secretion system protein ImpG